MTLRRIFTLSSIAVTLVSAYACGSSENSRTPHGDDDASDGSGGRTSSGGTTASGGKAPGTGGAAVGSGGAEPTDASDDQSVPGSGGTPTDASAPDARVRPDTDGCVPTSPATEVCDKVDNDCNGLIDDIDVGSDGIRDCLRFALVGNPGIYGSSNFQAWLAGNGVQVDRIQKVEQNPTLQPGALDAYDVVILDNLQRVYTPAEAAIFGAFVAAGGGLMSMSGYSGGPSDWTNPNSILTQFGIQYKVAGGLYSNPVTTFTPHPTTEGLTSVTFSGGILVDVPLADAGASLVVARLAQGPVGAVTEYGNGRVFIWGDEWVSFDSEWTKLPEIKTFWIDVVGWLGHYR